jgi:hypothetical protein
VVNAVGVIESIFGMRYSVLFDVVIEVMIEMIVVGVLFDVFIKWMLP